MGGVTCGIHAAKLDYVHRNNARGSAAADQYRSTAVLFSATRWLDVQVPDGLAATDDIRLEGNREIVLACRYLVGDLALNDIACR